MPGRKLPRTRLIWIVAAVLLLVSGVIAALRSGATADRTAVPFSDFLRDVQANQVKAVVAEGDAESLKQNAELHKAYFGVH